MTNRIAFGDVFADGSFFGGRVSAPGFDVLTESLGSNNIPFDTRYTNIGTVVTSGLVQCGGAAIPFDDMGYVPIVQINLWNGSRLANNNWKTFGGSFPHFWFPAQAIVTSNSIQVVGFEMPFYNTRAFYNPDGQFFAYYVFATG